MNRINLCDPLPNWERIDYDSIIGAESAAAPGGALLSETGPAHLPKRKLVFVVDDDPSMLRGVQRLLREYGYDSVAFASADAFQRHDNFGEAVCVVLDINLNKDCGIQLRRRLKSAGIPLPVIYITGEDNPATRTAAIESGCLAYLTKPFAAKSLIEPIQKVSAGLA